jgi:hypothetical protein
MATVKQMFWKNCDCSNKKKKSWVYGKTPWYSGKAHVQEVVSSDPGHAVETIYHAPLIWTKKYDS